MGNLCCCLKAKPMLDAQGNNTKCFDDNKLNCPCDSHGCSFICCIIQKGKSSRDLGVAHEGISVAKDAIKEVVTSSS